MKKLFILFALILLAACSADYDTFGTSNYHSFDSISFNEQEDNVTVYADEHKMKILLKPVSDSMETWDSVTVSDIDISSMASLFLVKSKFKEFPSDSAALDSLARNVTLHSSKIKKGQKLYLPRSHIIYMVVVSESGISSIWQIAFEIPGVAAEDPDDEPVDDSDGDGDSDAKSSSSISGDSSESSSSSVEEIESSSSVVVLSGATDLTIVFKDQAKAPKSGDSINVLFKNGSIESVSKAVVESFQISEGAKIVPQPDSVKEWKNSQTFEVTAEDGTVQKWVVLLNIAKPDEVISVSKDAELVSASAKGEVEKATIDAKEHSIVLLLPTMESLLAVEVSLVVSEKASHTLGSAALDLRSEKTFEIIAEDGVTKVEWKISADYVPLPQIQEIALGEGKVAGKIDEKNGLITFEMNYAKDLRLDSLEVASLKLSASDVSADVSEGSFYDFTLAKQITVKNKVGVTKTYKAKAGYQYPSVSITSSDWTKDDNGNKYDLKGWDNGNNSFTKKLAVSAESGEVLKMQTIKYTGKIASGNTFTAYFNPKNVDPISMLSYKDGNELIDFGRPFYGRPEFVEFDAKYEGGGDSCDMYILLESRMTSAGAIRTANEGKNQYRSSSDKNTLVASAWYRATDLDATDLPDVDAIKPASRSGYKTIRMKLQYGSPLEGSPLYKSAVLSKNVKNPNGIDNHLEETTSPDDFKVTHIRIVMASSANGNTYVGNEGATLWVDAIRLIY